MSDIRSREAVAINPTSKRRVSVLAKLPFHEYMLLQNWRRENGYDTSTAIMVLIQNGLEVPGE